MDRWLAAAFRGDIEDHLLDRVGFGEGHSALSKTDSEVIYSGQKPHEESSEFLPATV